MAEIPHAVLSEQFQELMQGRHLRSAVFLTYQFDPGFFEQEVLPVFLDIPLSHATAIKLVQLEDAVRGIAGHIAVYYDANGLILGDSGSAKLDFRRVPVQHRTGIFHPKNVFLLVEDEQAENSDELPSQSLLIATLSANLTRSGWWENVEAGHIEELVEGEKTRLKDDAIDLLESLRRKASAETEHAALRDILGFLKRTEQRQQKSAEGRLYPHFYSGRESIVDFLQRTVGQQIHGWYLEIISPYFDDADSCKPLESLIDAFSPKEVQVFLPRSAAGEANCKQELYESIKAKANVQWGRLPKEMTRLGKSDDAGDRNVHAKVYRFFTQKPKREIFFVGSANLTSAAHQTGGNVETGFLVDMIPPRRPEFWLTPDNRTPASFQAREEDEATATSGGTKLILRYHWDQERAEAYWDAPSMSPQLRLEARGIDVGTLEPVLSRTWIETPTAMSAVIREFLAVTSLFMVYGDGDKAALLLVQEEGMSHKPSLLFQLSAADILRYWALLTAEQRAAFLEARAPGIVMNGQGADLVTQAKFTLEHDTVFDRFAGFFHAFGCLERAVRAALAVDNFKEATYRLFGRKYDSLGNLLDRVVEEQGSSDVVDNYVIVMCARQMCLEVSGDYPDYWSEHVADAQALEERFSSLMTMRTRLIADNPDGFEDFLTWFDRWFLRRAQPVEVKV